jgi:DNA-binding NtrC family response regulator
MEPARSDGNGRGDRKPLEAVLEQLYRASLEVEGRSSLQLREWVERAEAWRIVQVLRECRGNRSAAARSLGIGRRTLYTKMGRLGVEPAWAALPGGEAPAPGTRAAALAASSSVKAAS